MDGFNERFEELNRQALLLAGDAKSDDARDEIDKLEKQIHRTRQVFERDFEFEKCRQETDEDEE